MKVEVICKDNNLKELLGITPVSYEDAIREAFKKIELNQVPSSWKDALHPILLMMEYQDMQKSRYMDAFLITGNFMSLTVKRSLIKYGQ